MKTNWFILGLIAITGLIVAMLLRPKPESEVADVASRQSSPASAAVTVQVPPPAEPVKSTQSQPALKPKPASQAQSPVQNVKPDKEPLRDPAAREALALVGLDPVAEQYWLDAIFDSSLPDTEREDLMEDLNETGFTDPKNLTAEDLPLIMNRLQIIDAVLPNADDFMAEHLLEAQKDLAIMFAQLAPQ